MLLRDVLPILDAIAPLRFAEPWDNVGLLAGDPAAPAARALLTVDVTPEVMAEAEAEAADLIVAYHPPLFEAIKAIPAGSVLHRAIRAGIALYSPHTAFDVAPGGTNDLLADVLGLVERAPLRLVSAAEGMGIGRAGELPGPVARSELIERVKRGLGVSGVLVAGPAEGEVSRVAVCAGAGRGLLGDALAKRAELYLTGELPHHDALRAAAAGVTVVCALHSNSERAALPRIKERLERGAPGLEVTISVEDRDPFSLR